MNSTASGTSRGRATTGPVLRALCAAALLAASATLAQAKSCDEVKREIAVRIEAGGVRGYGLEIVPAGDPVPAGAKVIGTCESGARKIVYRRFATTSTPADGVSPPSRADQAQPAVAVPMPARAPTVHEPNVARRTDAPATIASPPKSAVVQDKPIGPSTAALPLPAPAVHPPPTPAPAPDLPVPPATVGGGSAEAQTLHTIDQLVAQMDKAQIAFNAPATLNLGDTATVQLLLSLTESIDALQHALTAAGDRQGAQVSVAPTMQASLTGENFSISSVTPDEQALTSVGRTEWQWDVQPKSTGAQMLHLTLNAVFNLNGTPAERAVRTFDKPILVQVTWSRQLSGFVGNNWQWLWAVIVVPVAGWIWRSRRSAYDETGLPRGPKL